MKVEGNSQLCNSGGLEKEYLKFKEDNHLSYSLGIIGGINSERTQMYRGFLEQALEEARPNLKKFSIVFGGTKYGVSEIALGVAKSLDIPTVNVFPQIADNNIILDKNTDFRISVPTQPLSTITWGGETSTLISISDVFILFGGEWGTLTEVSMIMKKNNYLFRNGLPLKQVITVKGSGNLADNVKILSDIFPVVRGSFIEATSSSELATFLIQSINQKDDFEQ